MNTAPTGASGSASESASGSGEAPAEVEEDQPLIGRATRFKHLDRPATALSAEGESTIDVVDLEADSAASNTAPSGSSVPTATGSSGVASPAPVQAGKKKQKKRKGGDGGTPAGSPLKRTIDEADPVADSPASTPAKKKKKKKNGKSGASSAGEQREMELWAVLMGSYQPNRSTFTGSEQVVSGMRHDSLGCIGELPRELRVIVAACADVCN